MRYLIKILSTKYDGCDGTLGKKEKRFIQ